MELDEANTQHMLPKQYCLWPHRMQTMSPQSVTYNHVPVFILPVAVMQVRHWACWDVATPLSIHHFPKCRGMLEW